MATIALSLLGAAPTLIQGVASLVHGIENIFGKSNGAAKKAAVQSAFQGGVEAYNAAISAITGATGKQLPQFSGQSEAAFSALIDAIVGFYNATGIFQKSVTVSK